MVNFLVLGLIVYIILDKIRQKHSFNNVKQTTKNQKSFYIKEEVMQENNDDNEKEEYLNLVNTINRAINIHSKLLIVYLSYNEYSGFEYTENIISPLSIQSGIRLNNSEQSENFLLNNYDDSKSYTIKEELDMLSDLIDSLSTKRKSKFKEVYQSREGNERLEEEYLEGKDDTYLYAYCDTKSEFRNFNLKRIESIRIIKELDIDEVNRELMKIEYCNCVGIDYSDYDTINDYENDYNEADDNYNDYEGYEFDDDEYAYYEDDEYEDDFETDEECFYKGLEEGYTVGLALFSSEEIEDEKSELYEEYKDNEAFLEGFEYGFQEGKADARTYNVFYPPCREDDKYSDYYYDEENKNLENDIEIEEILFADSEKVMI